MEFASNHVVFVDHVAYTGRLEGEKVILEQEIAEIWHKLEVSKQRCADVEAKLVEGALTMARHAVGILKSCTLGLDIGMISCGYNYDRDKADELFDKSRAALEPFVEMLNLLVSDKEVE